MKKVFFPVILAVFMGVISGCISTAYQGESFPASASLKIFPAAAQLPTGYAIIGRGKAYGEFSGTDNLELQQKLQHLGMQHGADAMIIAGTRIVPDGKAVNDAPYNFIEATDDPDQTAFETNMQEIITSDPNAGNTRYMRIMYAVFLRKKRY